MVERFTSVSWFSKLAPSETLTNFQKVISTEASEEKKVFAEKNFREEIWIRTQDLRFRDLARTGFEPVSRLMKMCKNT